MSNYLPKERLEMLSGITHMYIQMNSVLIQKLFLLNRKPVRITEQFRLEETSYGLKSPH